MPRGDFAPVVCGRGVGTQTFSPSSRSGCVCHLPFLVLTVTIFSLLTTPRSTGRPQSHPSLLTARRPGAHFWAPNFICRRTTQPDAHLTLAGALPAIYQFDEIHRVDL